MSENVQPDAQFTMAQILRPFVGFESVYQGQPTSIPIAFPGTLDQDAGKPGFSPYLLAGLPVPLGAKVQLWFPMISGVVEGIPFDYVYELHWRLRNTGDVQRHLQPAHFQKETTGQPDTLLAPVPPGRFVLPSAIETVMFEQSEPTGLIGTGVGNLRAQAIAVKDDGVFASASAGFPLLPPGSAPFANALLSPATTGVTPVGQYQQGVLNPATSNLAGWSLFRPYFTVAKGDELIVTCVRNLAPPIPAIWHFDDVDVLFSNLYGINAAGPTHLPFPELGIYVFTGCNPT